MGFSVDFSGLEKLVKDMKITETDFNQFLYDFLLEMAYRIIAKTKPKTPVDTGALRNAWTITEIIGEGEELAVVLSNPMEYATEIEYGHRIVVGTGENKREVGWYNGIFMLRTSIDYIQKQMPARYNKAFKAFCAAHGIG